MRWLFCLVCALPLLACAIPDRADVPTIPQGDGADQMLRVELPTIIGPNREALIPVSCSGKSRCHVRSPLIGKPDNVFFWHDPPQLEDGATVHYFLPYSAGPAPTVYVQVCWRSFCEWHRPARIVTLPLAYHLARGIAMWYGRHKCDATDGEVLAYFDMRDFREWAGFFPGLVIPALDPHSSC